MQRFGPGFPSGFSRRLSSVVESRLVSGLAAIALLAIASTTSATAIVQVVWQETGTSSATVGAGALLTAEILITPDAAGISSYGVSIQFDDELMLAAAPPEEKLPSGFQLNLTPGVAARPPTRSSPSKRKPSKTVRPAGRSSPAWCTSWQAIRGTMGST